MRKNDNSRFSVYIISIALVIIFLSIDKIITKNEIANRYEPPINTSTQTKPAEQKKDVIKYNYPKKFEGRLPLSYSQQVSLYKLSKEKSAKGENAKKDLDKFRNQVLSQVGDNYLKELVKHPVVRFNENEFPIKVYIEKNPRMPNYYIPKVKEAFAAWNKATQGYLTFTYVKSKDNADIRYTFDDTSLSTCSKQEYIMAYTKTWYMGNKYKYANIKHSTKDCKGYYYQPQAFYQASVHEIGHALGLGLDNSHSKVKNDVMYYAVSKNGTNQPYEVSGISNRDVNTILFLYSIMPEIYNGFYKEEDVENMLYSPIFID